MPRSNFNITIKGAVNSGAGSNIGERVHSGYPKVTNSRNSSETTSGVSRRKPVGWVAPTNYSFVKRRIVYPQGTCAAKYDFNSSYGNWYTGKVGSTYGRFNCLNYFNELVTEANIDNNLSALSNAALIKARAKLKAQDVNLGVAFGERKQTARLVGDTATRLFKSLRHLKSGRIRRAMDELGITSKRRQPRGSNVPQKWLELQYGWKPLLSETYGAVDALNKRPPGDWRVTVKATEYLESSWEKVYTNSSWAPGIGRAEALQSAFIRIDALPQNAALIALSSLGVTNPLEVGWELVPFSFVVDWFLPIGGYLHSLDALLGYSSTGTWSSTSLLVKARWDIRGVSGRYGSWYVTSEWEGSKSVVRLTRTASQGVAIPHFPSIKDPRSLGHMANGLALLSQFFGRNR